MGGQMGGMGMGGQMGGMGMGGQMGGMGMGGQMGGMGMGGQMGGMGMGGQMGGGFGGGRRMFRIASTPTALRRGMSITSTAQPVAMRRAPTLGELRRALRLYKRSN
ncbi:MAG TPA: hypothetical protein EYG19_08950, partial [Verrucomicrobia bacterium]|nr:hypothetical protein [Verrucomicrobiota bacterium]